MFHVNPLLGIKPYLNDEGKNGVVCCKILFGALRVNKHFMLFSLPALHENLVFE